MSDMRRLIRIVEGITSPQERPGSGAARLNEARQRLAYTKLLNESQRLDFLLKTYGAKIEAKWAQGGEPHFVRHAVDEEHDVATGVLTFLSNCDPTPNGQYVQWLCLRWLKGGFKLEDQSRARDYLEVFHRPAVKVRLAKKDINAYASLSALGVAVRPFMEDANAMMDSSKKVDPALLARMSRPDQTKFLCDTSDVTMLTPLTEQSSIFWATRYGVKTEWCTGWEPPRQNLFDSYNDDGPLYIIILKPEGTKYQLHVHSASFMDKNDDVADLAEVIQAHPAIIEALPSNEKANLTQFGLYFFPKETIEKMGPRALADELKKKSDIKMVPERMLGDYEFQKEVFRNGWNVYDWLDRKYWLPNLAKELVRAPYSFGRLPEDLQTQEDADMVATKLSWANMEEVIPEALWSPTVTKCYWDSRKVHDIRLRIRDVPDEYRDALAITQGLMHFPEDIPEYGHLLPPDLLDLVKRRAEHLKQRNEPQW